MTDQTPFGWSATSETGAMAFFTGAQPDPTKYTAITLLADQADYDAAVQLARNPPVTLSSAQAAQVALLRAACTAAITGGFASSALGALHGYPSDDTSQTNLTASVMASLLPNLPAGWSTPFWAADTSNTWSFAPHTAAQISRSARTARRWSSRRSRNSRP